MSKYPEYKHLNLPQISQEILADWKAKKTFEKSVSTRAGKPSFTFYEGPPSANGMPEFIMLWGEPLKISFVDLKPCKVFKSTEKLGGILMGCQ